MGKRGPKPLTAPRRSLLGLTFGELSVVSLAGRTRFGKWLWNCRCLCGGEVVVEAGNLVGGHSTKCGACRRALLTRLEKEFGAPLEREYRKWRSAIERCRMYAANRKNYFDRGIRVCSEWAKNFEAFIRHIGPCPEGLTLDRIDNDRGYEPGNVRWASRSVQARNRRPSAYSGRRKH